MSYTELSNKPVTKTKIDHRCEWCDQLIKAGEKAQYRSYVYYGEMHSAWKHPECAKACAIVAHEERLSFIPFEWNPGDYERGGTECIT